MMVTSCMHYSYAVYEDKVPIIILSSLFLSLKRFFPQILSINLSLSLSHFLSRSSLYSLSFSLSFAPALSFYLRISFTFFLSPFLSFVSRSLSISVPFSFFILPSAFISNFERRHVRFRNLNNYLANPPTC